MNGAKTKLTDDERLDLEGYYDELNKIVATEEFAQIGFAKGGQFYQFARGLKDHFEKKPELTPFEFMVQAVHILGLELRSSGGRDTEYILSLKKSIESALTD